MLCKFNQFKIVTSGGIFNRIEHQLRTVHLERAHLCISGGQVSTPGLCCADLLGSNLDLNSILLSVYFVPLQFTLLLCVLVFQTDQYYKNLKGQI